MSGASAPAPALAPHRVLALDALRLRRGLRDAQRRPSGWGEAKFATEVEQIRRHLAPHRNRRCLTASFGREAFQTLGFDQSWPTAPRQAPFGPIRAAYAIRWRELGSGASLPAWRTLLTIESA